MVKVVKTQSKGMVTIPVEFREKLGIDADTLLEAKIVKGGVLFVKVKIKPDKVELYSDKQIKKLVEEDKLDSKTEKKLMKLLK